MAENRQYDHEYKVQYRKILGERKLTDVIHRCMNDLSKAIKEKEQARYDKLCEEFGRRN